MARTNRTSRNADRDAARLQEQQAAQQEADAAGQEQPQDAPEPEVTESDSPVTEVQPEPEVTESEQTDTPATPEPQDTPDAEPQPEPGPEPEPTVVTDSEQTVTEPEPEPEPDAEQPQAAPDTDGTEPPAQADGEGTPDPEPHGGYTEAPDPDAEPVTSLQPQASFAGLLAVAVNTALSADTRWSALVQAGAQLIARLARTPEGEGDITYIPYAIPGANGSGPARMYALAQLLYVFGSDMVGRIITHDNTARRPGQMRITVYAANTADIVAFLEAAFPVLDIWGGVARKERREMRARLGETNTYLDNRAERAELLRQGRNLAQDIARASEQLGLTPDEVALYVFHVRRLKANAATALKHERHYLEEWNQPQHLGGYPVPAMFTGTVTAPALAGSAA